MSRTARAQNPLTIDDGSGDVLTLRIETDAPSTMLIVGAVSVQSAAATRVRVVIDGESFEPAFGTDFTDASIPIPLHARVPVSAGAHEVRVLVEGSAPLVVSERVATAMIYRERE